LIGWTGNRSPRSRRMQQVWRDGSFAEKALYPARCLTPLPGADGVDVAKLPFVASLAIADGALKRGGLRGGGQTLVINGATGQLGGAAVLVALARGAGRILATGRNREKLEELATLSSRIVACPLSGERAADAERLKELSDGGADLAVDYLGHAPTATATLAAIDALKLGGTAVLVGGVRHELPLSYQTIMRRQLTIRGSFMFDRDTALECWRLVRSGAIDLALVKPRAFKLDEIEAAMTAAATLNGFNVAVLLPNA
jgi:alcohol dehydrogenase